MGGRYCFDPESAIELQYRKPKSAQATSFPFEGKVLMAFGATAKYCAFYPLSPSTVEAHKEERTRFHYTQVFLLAWIVTFMMPVAMVIYRLTRSGRSENMMEGVFVMGKNQATRITVAVLGILVGLAGIDHGFFETLQGNVRPDSVMIEAIGPVQRFWQYGTETALTIIPSFLISGILSIVIGVMVMIWALAFVHRRYGAVILLLLTIGLFLVGGGFAPIFLSILASYAATRINKPLRWWRAHLPAILRSFLARLWPPSLVALVVLFVVTVEIAILGYPLLRLFTPETTFSIQFTFGYIMLGFVLLSILSGFAQDSQRQSARLRQKS
jgi:hypothetical protein